jgi:hypothetical protein
MPPAKHTKVRVLERLDTNAHPGHSRAGKSLDRRRVNRVGIALHGDLSTDMHDESTTDILEELGDLRAE